MKKMKYKKMTALILTVIMVFGLFGAFPLTAIAATPTGTTTWTFTASSPDETNEYYYDGTYSWVQSTKTLTLNNINYSTTAITALSVPNDTTIVVNGTNNISSTYNGSGSSFGIRTTSGNLTINGSGRLDVTAGTTDTYSQGIYTNGGLIINGNVNVTALGGNSNASYGIESYGDITISGNAFVYAAGGNGDYTSIGIDNVNNSSLIISGNANVTAAAGSLSSGNSRGVYVGRVTLNDNANLNASGGYTSLGTGQGYGISLGGGDADRITINGGMLTALGTYRAISHNYNVPDGYTYWTNTVMSSGGATGPLTGDGTINTQIGSSYKYAKIEAPYTLFLDNSDGKLRKNSGGPDITSQISKSAIVSGNPGAWVLTLSDFNFSTKAATALSLPTGTAITLNGDNAITCTSTGDNTRGINANNGLIINGSGSLSVTNTAGGIGCYGISAGNEGGLIINGGTVTVVGKDRALQNPYTVPGGYLYWTNTSATATGATGPGIGDGTTNTRIDNTHRYAKIEVPVPVTGITLSGGTSITASGGTLQLTANITPGNATNKNVTWTVASGSASASVSDSGLVTALANGTAVIRATAQDGTGKYGEATINITGQPTLTYVVNVIGGTGSGSYTAGASVTITADAAPAGKMFDKWISDDVIFANANNESTAFTMPAKAVTVTATYKDLPPSSYSVTVQNDGNGTANSNVTSATQGTAINLTATPKSGYKFKEWQVVSGGVTIVNNQFTMPAANVVVKAIFEIILSGGDKPTIKPIDGDSISGGGGVPGALVEIILPDGRKATTTADANGNWTVTIPGASNVTQITIIIYDLSGKPVGRHTMIKPEVKVTGIKTLPTLYLVKGKKITLPGAVQPYMATNKSVTWKSKNKKVATVTSKGLVKGIKKGSTKITVTTADGKKIATCKVTVVSKAKKLKAFTITPKKATNLVIGKTLQVKPKLKPAKATGATGIVPTYKSGNTKVAVIDKAGVITALSAGKTTITVKAGKKTKQFVLTVK